MSLQARGKNNKGVLLLQCGRYNDAIANFRSAFDIIAKKIKDDSTKTNRTNTKINPSITLQWVKIYGVHPLNGSKEENDSDNRSFVYKRALAMGSGFEAPSPEQEAAIILFNLALVSHLLALTGGKGRAQLLRTSLTLYGRANKFLKMGIESSAFSSITKTFHIVALNNVGQIYYELGRYEAAASCFRHVSVSIEEIGDQDAVDEAEVNGMKINIMTLKPPVYASAA